jgi:ABC-type Fe3+ transport system permease subunit
MEIHRADPAYRNRTVLLLAFTVLLCVVLLLLLDAWLGRVNGRLMNSDPDTVRRWLQGLLAGLGIALAVPDGLLGVGLRRLGLASRIEGRFPPQAWKTLRDVRVLRDADALRWAHRTELAGLAAIALAVLLVTWSGWAWWRFG